MRIILRLWKVLLLHLKIEKKMKGNKHLMCIFFPYKHAGYDGFGHDTFCFTTLFETLLERKLQRIEGWWISLTHGILNK